MRKSTVNEGEMTVVYQFIHTNSHFQEMMFAADNLKRYLGQTDKCDEFTSCYT